MNLSDSEMLLKNVRQSIEKSIVLFSGNFSDSVTLNVMNINQRFIFTVGLLIACLHCARQVSESQATVKDFVILITY
jgi:ABC-type transport system involved in Fe-S cluster assembly fused permease/ATPase subunit